MLHFKMEHNAERRRSAAHGDHANGGGELSRADTARL